MAAEVRWLRGMLLCYADKFRSGVAEIMAGIEALEAMPSAPTQMPAAIEAWYADALPVATSVDAEDQHAVAPRGTADYAGLARRPPRSVPCLSWTSARGGRTCGRCVTVLAAVPGTRIGVRAAIAFASHGLGIAQAGLGRPEEARQALTRARAIFVELDHHALVAFTLLDQLRDVALTYDAAIPPPGAGSRPRRRRRWAGLVAHFDRASRPAWPGWLPHPRWPLAGGGPDLAGLPAPGNACLRREITAARAVLARYRGDPEARLGGDPRPASRTAPPPNPAT